MMNFMKEWVVNIISVALIVTLFEILVPSGKIKKFVLLVSGFIMIIVIISPFINFLKKDIDILSMQFLSSNYMDKVEIQEKSKILKDSQMKDIIEIYRQKLIEQITHSLSDYSKEYAVQADVIINEDYNNENFGEVKRALINLTPKINPDSAITVVKIDNISIQENKKENIISDELKEKIERRINNVLEIQKENIVVSVYKD